MEQPLPLLESSAATSPSPASNHLHLSPPHHHDFLRSSGLEKQKPRRQLICGKLLSSTRPYPEAREAQSSAVWKWSGENTAYYLMNYPATQTCIIWESQPFQGANSQPHPLRKILPASACGLFRIMDSWKADLDMRVTSEYFLRSFVVSTEPSPFTELKRSLNCNSEEEIFKQGLKELQLARDVRGVGNKQQSRAVRPEIFLRKRRPYLS